MKKIGCSLFLNSFIRSCLTLFLPLLLGFCSFQLEATNVLDDSSTKKKMELVLQNHALYHQLSDELVKRQMLLLVESIDSSKIYLLKSEVDSYTNPSPSRITKIKKEWVDGNFQELDTLAKLFAQAIKRAHKLDEEAKTLEDSPPVDREALKREDWPSSIEELQTRRQLIKKLETEILAGLEADRKLLIEKRIKKAKTEHENHFLQKDFKKTHQHMLDLYLHAFAASMDAHTVYFTPDEARLMQNMIQRKITGIGVVLHEDLEGYKVISVVDGSPAALSGKVLPGDHIVAVDGEPTLGLELHRGILLIQGQKGTPVMITLQRKKQPHEITEISPEKFITFELQLLRDDIVVKENRYKTYVEPFGDGKIACLSLYSFYDDGKSSSATDLRKELVNLKKEGNLKAVILDLRYNTGGLMIGSVELCSLFIHPGIIVSTKSPSNQIQHMRLIRDDPVWEGPLIVLVNRLSASSSEIFTGAMQDFGRALIVGDSSTMGKGSFQFFTKLFDPSKTDPYGDFTITQGIYYTVSGNSPQLSGIKPDIIVEGSLQGLDIGESTLRYPLPKQAIEPNYEDKLEDMGPLDRLKYSQAYLPRLQKRIESNYKWLSKLRENSQARQAALEEGRKNSENEESTKSTATESYLKAEIKDRLQWQECLNIAKDWLMLELQSQFKENKQKCSLAQEAI